MQRYLYNLATDKSQGLFAGALKFILFLLSLIYGLLIRVLIRINLAFVCQLNSKVISVGNITLGGTGKTSLVEFIAKALRDKGRKTAILTRGYKRKVITYDLGLRTYETMGDESYMLSKKLGDIPVIVNADRIKAAQQAIKDFSLDTVILDDAFQQWRIKKDLEIVTIDALSNFGNRQMLPRGILREPLSSLRRADIFVLTKVDLGLDIGGLKIFLKQINPASLIVESTHTPIAFYRINQQEGLISLESLKGKTVGLISGIGDPDSFEKLISNLGINIGLSLRFGDHHDYSERDLENIVRLAQKKNIATLITTEKDAVRFKSLQLKSNYSLELLVLRIALKIIKNEAEFLSRLFRLPGL